MTCKTSLDFLFLLFPSRVSSETLFFFCLRLRSLVVVLFFSHSLALLAFSPDKILFFFFCVPLVFAFSSSRGSFSELRNRNILQANRGCSPFSRRETGEPIKVQDEFEFHNFFLPLREGDRLVRSDDDGVETRREEKD
jgi:hypothetical protein